MVDWFSIQWMYEGIIPKFASSRNIFKVRLVRRNLNYIQSETKFHEHKVIIENNALWTMYRWRMIIIHRVSSKTPNWFIVLRSSNHLKQKLHLATMTFWQLGMGRIIVFGYLSSLSYAFNCTCANNQWNCVVRVLFPVHNQFIVVHNSVYKRKYKEKFLIILRYNCRMFQLLVKIVNVICVEHYKYIWVIAFYL